jgi:hypothetical protein
MEWLIYIPVGLASCLTALKTVHVVMKKRHFYYHNSNNIDRLDEPYNSLLARKKFTSSDVKQAMNSSKVKPKPVLEATSKAKALPASTPTITQKADNVRNSIRNSLLPTESKQVASTIVNGSESLLEKTLTNEQEHIVETILFTHVPDLVELFSNLTTEERASLKQVERLTNQLSKLKGAILEVDEQVAKAARDKWETNEFYLDAKFPSSPELTTN